MPAHFADERVAWEGAYPEDPQSSLRIEAAALDGRPTSLRRFTPAKPLQPPTNSLASLGTGFLAGAIAAAAITALMVLTAVFGGLYVARRNVRSGRGDVRGARRLGFGVALTIGTAWLTAEHTLSLSDINAFIDMLIFVSAAGGITWALYLAVEPFMRRQAPEALIGWTRFVDGRWADPFVGRDLLLGCGAGVLTRLLVVVPRALAPAHQSALADVVLPPESLIELLASLMGNASGFVILALGMSFLYGIAFLVVGRRPWCGSPTRRGVAWQNRTLPSSGISRRTVAVQDANRAVCSGGSCFATHCIIGRQRSAPAPAPRLATGRGCRFRRCPG